MNLFWPEWRAPVLGDVDFSGSELNVELAPGQKLTLKPSLRIPRTITAGSYYLLGVVDPEFRTVDLICTLVHNAGDRAALVDLGAIAERTRQRKPG